MLKKIRVTLAVVSILLVTLLFVDFTGMAHVWLGWMAKIQRSEEHTSELQSQR